MIEKMHRMATRPGCAAKSPLSHLCVIPGLVVFTVVVAVPFGDSDAGGSVDLWGTVSLDVWCPVVA